MERPILFSTPMVRAILEGKKAQTRRVIKPQPVFESGYDYPHENELGIFWKKEESYRNIEEFIADCTAKCPYGKPDDTLWVRETWGNWSYDNPDCNAVYYRYKADYPNGAKTYMYDNEHECDLPKWHPSIHMPRAAARIFLQVKNIRVERLRDITWQDCLREGIDHNDDSNDNVCNFCDLEEGQRGVKNFGNGPMFCFDSGQCEVAQGHFKDDCIDCFAELWDGINKARGYGWDTNPWVWVVEFEKL